MRSVISNKCPLILLHCRAYLMLESIDKLSLIAAARGLTFMALIKKCYKPWLAFALVGLFTSESRSTRNKTSKHIDKVSLFFNQKSSCRKTKSNALSPPASTHHFNSSRPRQYISPPIFYQLINRAAAICCDQKSCTGAHTHGPIKERERPVWWKTDKNNKFSVICFLFSFASKKSNHHKATPGM